MAFFLHETHGSTEFVQAPGGTIPEIGTSSLPSLPSEFYAVVQTTALYLDKDAEYPPSVKRTTVWYDSVHKKVRAEFEANGQPWRALYRRYDKGMEFEILHVAGREKTCQFSKMKEKMPSPEWPETLSYKGTDIVRGKFCHHWQEDNGYYKVDYYETVGPVRVPVLIHTEGMDYDVLEFRSGPIDQDIFHFPPDLRPNCTKVPNHVGFPYVHLLYTYLRF
eukprot:CAMPEP_0196662666 /NCGR_PEP_ID=MMETSP1086-20130531/49834_1 /TAXON_ID=77921 /ORGANISM="Cyanoptyche  gloeocystis , Strain SAG4.97" /LENGTH=219 /DNA_ID=CAMNT_0041998183 /DNA_START=90 /DNA_END=749 /DNA_ORIENTATION=+